MREWLATVLNTWNERALTIHGHPFEQNSPGWLARRVCLLANTFDLDTTMAEQGRQAQLTKPSRKLPPLCMTGSCSGGPHRKAGLSRTRTRAWVPLRALHHAQLGKPLQQPQRCWSLRPRPLQCCSNPPFFLSEPLLLCQSSTEGPPRLSAEFNVCPRL